MKKNCKIEVYGDSILKGVLLDKNTKKYSVIKNNVIDYICSKMPLNIKNNARFGYTVTKGFNQLEYDLNKGLNCDAVILEYGGNDCDFDWKMISENPQADCPPKTSLKEFENTYINMINKLKEKSITPILTSLPPINAEKYIDWICRNGLNKNNIVSWLGDIQMIYRFQELYSKTVEKIANKTGTMYVDLRSAFLDKHNFKDLLCDDGIHPNEDGHKIIADTFYSFAASL